MNLNEIGKEFGVKAEYMGDGVYATFDGYQIWLHTMRENGWHRVALEDSALANLLDFRRRCGKDTSEDDNKTI
jgi:hypothetical protein